MIKERFEDVYNTLVKYLKVMNEQFFNVLGNSDKIKYDKIGTVEAYVLIHFLDRFQMTLDILKGFLKRSRIFI